ncbi:hypothetical protein I79_015884 [Cricetulus griseus]|uniref:Uncharacterized protein n=1 Tax=Cricetulus griseus TaxID=10029 RepID=G3HXW8_CRIGR|nr:hypothetical protein I79_015884 [Cricetulus griseus]
MPERNFWGGGGASGTFCQLYLLWAKGVTVSELPKPKWQAPATGPQQLLVHLTSPTLSGPPSFLAPRSHSP